jgi:hypothetical protein
MSVELPHAQVLLNTTVQPTLVTRPDYVNIGSWRNLHKPELRRMIYQPVR